jgi:asparagine synthase (glutamine-hydrolysing)
MINLLFDKNKKSWISDKEDNITILFSGNIFIDGKHYKKYDATKILLSKLSNIRLKDFKSFIKDIEGQFAFIFNNGNFTIAFADKIRSFPIFYYKLHETFYISNSESHFNKIRNNFQIDDNSLVAFNLSGYTIGDSTLYKGFNIISPGEYIVFDNKGNKIESISHYKFFNESTSINEDKLFNKLNNVIDSSIEKTIQIANGKKIVIPLSAGFDSRLLLGKILEKGYSNILCYTYGSSTIWEKEVAERCTNLLNVNWVFIKFDTSTKKIFGFEDRKKYYLTESGFSSVPHIADYYALHYLVNKKIIDPDNCIIVNGQSGDFISGGHISQYLFKNSEENILDNIINKHYSLWKNKLTEKNINIIKNKLRENYKIGDYINNKELIAKEYELLECNERQIKYVINGQRAYDWFGIDWYLPLWSDDMLLFWEKIPIKYKIKQKLYIDYCLKYNPCNVFNIKIPKKHLSIPFYLYPMIFLLKTISKLSKKHSYSTLKRTYLYYFDKYAPYYPQKSYFLYLKNSKYHRHPVSYWVETYLKEIGIK